MQLLVLSLYKRQNCCIKTWSIIRFAISWLHNLCISFIKRGKVSFRCRLSLIEQVLGESKCSDYRTISLMSNLVRFFYKLFIIQYTHVGWKFGFKSSLGTREALLVMYEPLQTVLRPEENISFYIQKYEKNLL